MGRGHLPLDPTSLIGRLREVRRVRSLLGSARLVCLTGPGGVGKTRIALRVADNAAKAFPDGVWLVELGSLRDPALVEATVAAALSLEDGRALGGRLGDRIRSWNALLILDNCEHLVQASADLVSSVLIRAPGVRVLATSREALQVRGEHVVRVSPLEVPENPDADVAALLRCESVQLLAERAMAVQPCFRVDESNAADVAQLCRRLDGVPLAIELAAARLRSLSVRQVLDRLDDSYRILNAAPRDVPPRQRSLEATIAWSYRHCAPLEQRLWARMSVFSGPVGIEAVTDVCSLPETGEEDIVDLVDGLVQKSILTREDGAAEFRMLDTIRRFGARQLDPAGSDADLQRRYADHHRRLVDELAQHWFGGEQRSWHSRMRRALPDLRVVVDHDLQHGRIDAALHMTAGLFPLWVAQGMLREGNLWLTRAVAAASPESRPLSRALWVHGWIQLLLGEVDAARASLRRSVRMAQAHGDAESHDYATALLAAADAFQGHYDRAIAACRRALDGRRRAGDDQAAAFIVFLLAEMYWARGDLDLALACAEEAENRCAPRGEQWCGSYALWTRGLVHYLRGEYTEATAVARRSLELKRSLNDTLGILLASEVVCWGMAGAGQWAEAGRLHAAIRPMWDRTCSPLMGFGNLIEHRNLWAERIRARLGATRYRRAEAAGAAMGIDDIATVALGQIGEDRAGRAEARAPRSEFAGLTRREVEVARLVAQGLANKQIAAQLVIAPRTAEVHVERLRMKLGFSRRAQIAAWWHQSMASAGPR
ncbi:ATP-binding protein [Pseudonocardia hispaniensis]|uniref:ATP-binding protein n=1 Tax=Pseudonocardia hispaniensis TaxID=904933 RepID=A0ABW1J1V0_9PSEU